MSLLNRVKTEVLDILFPPLCFKCSREGTFLCDVCKKMLTAAPPQCFVCKKWTLPSIHMPRGRTCAPCQKKTHLYAYYSPYSYKEETIRSLIHSFKYNRARMLGAPLAKLFIEYCKKFSLTLPAEALLIPIPLYKSRRRTRGFNQADIIAKYIGEHLTLPVANNILHKTKKTQSQVDLSQDERRQNIVGSFTVVNTDPIKNKTVILVDDIKTTGATLETAACVLDAAGAKKIWAITIAH